MARVCRVLLASLLGLIILATPVAGAFADTKIAVVDIDKLLANSIAAKAAEKRLNAQREKLEKEFVAKDKELKDQVAKLEKEAKEAKGTKPEELKKKVADFAEAKKKAEQELLKQKLDLDASFRAATKNLQTEIVKVVTEIAAAEKINLVLSSPNVVVAEKEMDITDKVLAKLNETVKDVSTTPKKK
jgi:outer membrane protein